MEGESTPEMGLLVHGSKLLRWRRARQEEMSLKRGRELAGGDRPRLERGKKSPCVPRREFDFDPVVPSTLPHLGGTKVSTRPGARNWAVKKKKGNRNLFVREEGPGAMGLG